MKRKYCQLLSDTQKMISENEPRFSQCKKTIAWELDATQTVAFDYIMNFALFSNWLLMIVTITTAVVIDAAVGTAKFIVQQINLLSLCTQIITNVNEKLPIQ